MTDFKIEKIHVEAKSRQLNASWYMEEPQYLVAQHGMGTVPIWLDTVFQWGSFGKWLERKTLKIRKRLNWLYLDDTLADILAEEITHEINREIIDKLRKIADDK